MSSNIITIVRGGQKDEELTPVFTLYKGNDGLYYAIGDNPKFCVSKETPEEATTTAITIVNKYHQWKEDDAA
jgi:hypothetical protein